MGTRIFSGQFDDLIGRTVDQDAPIGFRLELIDAVFQLVNDSFHTVSDGQLYRVMVQSMGIAGAPGNPMNGFRDGAGRQIRNLEWPRVYDLICRWWTEFSEDLRLDYVRAVNIVLSGNRIAWDLRPDGTMARVLPTAIQNQVQTTFAELRAPRFASALTSFQSGMDAYNARPQRGRDACKNAMDALESVAKEVYALPSATFGGVLNDMRSQQPPAAAGETISVLQKLYEMANKHFRHGMTTPFTLRTVEVDFVVVSCMAGILLFVRL
jgi:hypothetical protein